jgi:hypothetical protein
MDKHTSLLFDENNLACCRFIRHEAGSQETNALAYSMRKTTLLVSESLDRLTRDNHASSLNEKNNLNCCRIIRQAHKGQMC